MATGLGSLNRLQWKQLSFSQMKSQLLGDVIAVAYFWLIEIVFFFLAKSDGMELPPMLTSAVILCFLVPDIICKLIFENDITVMDSFLKTRPVPQELWDRFLAMSQLWKPSNLIIPLMLLPACFLFLPVLYGLIVFAALYIVSVFNGFVVMRIKHRGPYLSEKEVKSHYAGSLKSAKGNYISGLPIRDVLRLKKLRRSLIPLTLIMYFQLLVQSMSNVKFGLSFALLYIFCLSSSILQYGFSVEANFFNCLWTKPLAIEKLLEDKYRFAQKAGAVGLLTCLPVCLWTEIQVLDLVSVTLFTACFGALVLMVGAYDCIPMDMFGNSFYKGGSSGFKAVSLLVVLIVFGIGTAAVLLLSGWKFQVLLSVIGIAGFCLHKQFLRWMAGRFMANRYKYLKKYMSQ